MAKNVNLSNIMIAGPGDTAEEAKALSEAMLRWNKMHTNTYGLMLQALRWSEDATAGFADDGQDLIDMTVVGQSDLIIAVFKAKMGTIDKRTGEYYTVGEIKEHLKAGKQAVLIFVKPEDGSLMNNPEGYRNYADVLDFQNDLLSVFGKSPLFLTFKSILHLQQDIDLRLDQIVKQYLITPSTVDEIKKNSNSSGMIEKKHDCDTGIKKSDTFVFGQYPQSLATFNMNMRRVSSGANIYTDSSYTYIKLEKTTPVDLDNAPDAKYSDGSSIESREEQFFKFEPIYWKILYSDSEKSLLLSTKILDWQHFTDKKYISKHGGRYITSFPGHSGEIANSWGASMLRKWLNTEFLATAFSSLEQSYIVPYNDDKVFVLSTEEASREDFGFSSDINTPDTNRLAPVTDYAIARGVRLSYATEEATSQSTIVGWWWLRTPGDPVMYFIGQDYDSLTDVKKLEALEYSATRVCDVMHDGHICTRGSIIDGVTKSKHADAACDGTENGVRVAIWVDNSFFKE